MGCWASKPIETPEVSVTHVETSNIQQMTQTIITSSISTEPSNQHWLSRVRSRPWDLKDAPEDIRTDKKIVMAAIEKDRLGMAFKYATWELQNDKQFVLMAVQQNGLVLKHAGPKLKNDKEVVMAAVQQSGCVLRHASRELRNDKDVVLAAVGQDFGALEYATPDVQNMQEIQDLVYQQKALRAKEQVLDEVFQTVKAF